MNDMLKDTVSAEPGQIKDSIPAEPGPEMHPLQDPLRMNTTVLAWTGDAVYELYIRKYLIASGKIHADRLHRDAVKFVRASSQAAVMRSIFDGLSEDEQRLVKRARNKSPNTRPKNSDLIEYKWATGFEALLGYYYLAGMEAELENTINAAIKYIEGSNI